MREWKTLRAAKAAAFYSMPNMQSGIGAFIGLMSLSLLWVNRFRAEGYNAIETFWPPQLQFTIFGVMEHVGPDGALFGALFIIGTIIALASPIGGIFQGIGLVGVAFQMDALSYSRYAEAGQYYHIYVVSAGPGFLLAVVSALMVLTSVSAIRAANGGRPARAISRFAALSPGSMSVFR